MSDNKDTHQDLNAKLDDLSSKLNDIEKNIPHEKPVPETDVGARTFENDEVLEALENETNTTIDSIKNALKRMEEGSYGTCIVCGVEISEERIKALPYTDICFECSNK
jgi:RNA polymerase-binding transcription factor DksA